MYVYDYKVALGRCETSLTESFTKLSEYSKRKKSYYPSRTEPSQRNGVYIQMKKKLDKIQERVTKIKSGYEELTQRHHSSSLSDDNFSEKYFDYLEKQEVLRLKFIRIIAECKRANSSLNNILNRCLVEASDANCIQNQSKCFENVLNHSNTAAEFDRSLVPKIHTSKRKLNLNDDLNNSSAVKKCYSANDLGTETTNVTNSSKGNKVSCIKQSIVCNICKKTLTTKTSLRMHMLIHEGLKPNKCTECSYSCVQKGSLRMHMLIHEGLKPNKCTECSYSCVQKGSLKRHVFAKHIPYHSKGCKCNFCDISVKQSIICKICQKTFTTKKSLRMHMFSHESLKFHKCTECSFSCVHKTNLNRHIFTQHIPYHSEGCKCNFCGGDVKRHIPCCLYCGFRCEDKDTLAYHIKKEHVPNLSLEEYSCSICGAIFHRNKNRIQHERRIHAKKNGYYGCMKCGKVFKREKYLEKHLKCQKCVPK